jgi:hypothetical protein
VRVTLSLRAILGGVAGLALGLGLGLGLSLGTAAPAGAAPAACSPEGTTVVVDLGELAPAGEDDVRTGCDDSVEGDRAGASIADAGFDLTYATRDPGFICRVGGVPADDPCVNAAPADAYWSLWWADADSDAWVYSSRGAGTLRTPPGGLLALVWHQGDGRAAPPQAGPQEVAPSNGGDRASAQAAETSSLPVWVPLTVIAALLGAGALVLARRRRA